MRGNSTNEHPKVRPLWDMDEVGVVGFRDFLREMFSSTANATSLSICCCIRQMDEAVYPSTYPAIVIHR